MTDQLSTQEKLNLETASITWKELQICFAQGKLLITDSKADLIEVATIVAENDTNKLQSIIETGKIFFATPKWIKNHCDDSTNLWAVVVAPYVIAQLKR